MSASIRDIIEGIYPLPEQSAEKLTALLEERSFERGHRILQAGKVETNIYFISRGLAGASISVKDRESIFWIGKEGSAIVSLKSYIDNRPGYETVRLIEDSVLYVLERGELHKLFAEDIHIANWGRAFAESEFLRTEQRLISLLYMSATERYEELLKNNPDLLQRMSLESLASYLGITPVSLSRIRAKLARGSLY